MLFSYLGAQMIKNKTNNLILRMNCHGEIVHMSLTIFEAPYVCYAPRKQIAASSNS